MCIFVEYMIHTQADNLSDPKEVFQFMEVGGVCGFSVWVCLTHHATLHHSLANTSQHDPAQHTHTQANDIGQTTMLYYAAYASYLELKGSYARADKIYQDGIQRYDGIILAWVTIGIVDCVHCWCVAIVLFMSIHDAHNHWCTSFL